MVVLRPLDASLLVCFASSVFLGGCGLDSSAIAGNEVGVDAAGDAGGGWPDAAADADGRTPDADAGAVDASLDAVADAAPDAAVDTSPTDAGVPFCESGAPVLCIRFEDALVDESAAGHGFRESGLTFAAGRVGRAGDFGSGMEVWIDQDGDLTGEPLTVELFLNPRALPSSGRMGIWDIGGQHSAWAQPGGAFSCRSIRVDAALTVGTWTHVACVFDGDSSMAYVDGVLAATGTSSPGTSAPGAIRLGADNPDGDYFEGLIDEMRIYRGVRTPAEIAAAAAR